MHNLSLPKQGWGELHVERAEPYAGKEWTDSGRNRDQRPLKQRARGEVRVVPCPPGLTELLHAHLAEFGVQPDGRLFVGERNGGELPTMTIGRMWRRARQAAFMPEVAASPLARTPYDLRHAAVSTWLNGGVPATTVAEWAGHSVEILLRIYAKCLDGGDAEIRRRAQAALGHADKDRNVDTRLDTDVRPRPDLTGYRRTHNPAADPRFCWSAAGLCWWWMVAPTYPYANRVPLVTGPTIRLAAPRSRAGADG